MKSIYYRVWDNENQKYFEPTYEALNGKLEDLHIGLKGDLFMRTLDGTIHCDSIFPGRFVIEEAVHRLDSTMAVIHVGDVVEVENDGPVITECKWHEGSFTLIDQAGGHWTRQLYHQPERLKIVGNIHSIFLKAENVYFPLGVQLASLENGKLIIAPPGTPRDKIVGVVTLNGLETK